MTENSIQRLENIATAAEMYLKGSTYAKISKTMNISVAQVKGYIEEWNSYISDEASRDPDILNRFLENVLAYKQKLNLISDQAWNVAELAEEAGAMSTKIQALRLAKDLAEMEARAMQLMSNRMESGYIERMKRVERVNGILSSIIKEIISGCERCSEQAWRRLEEAYRIIPEDDIEEVAELTSGEDNSDE